MSPTWISFARRLTKPAWPSTSTYLLFSYLSLLCRFKSSIKSLTMLIAMTMSSGRYIVGLPSEILMAGTSCSSPIMKKYMLAGLLNCSMRLNTRNEAMWYLAVLILLLHSYRSGTLVMMWRSGNSVKCGRLRKGFHRFCLYAFSYFMFMGYCYYHGGVLADRSLTNRRR
jgi:hypothetical protein